MISKFERELILRAKQQKSKSIILFPETADERILAAIQIIIEENLIIPAVLEDPIRIVNRFPTIQHEKLYYIKPLSIYEDNELKESLDYAAHLLNKGVVDGVIAGAITPSSKVLKTAFSVIGKKPDVSTVSAGIFIISNYGNENSENVYLFSDVAVTIEPSSEQLFDITLSTIETWEKVVKTTPKVAMLSFSTLGSAKHKSIDTSVKVIEEIKKKKPFIEIFGEIQFDAAINTRIALTKGLVLPENGANIMIFPNLAAANIGYKIAQHLGKAKTMAVMQGLNKPFFDISRGSTIDEIVSTCALIALYLNPDEKDV